MALRISETVDHTSSNVSIIFENHHQILVDRLWGFFQCSRDIDFEIRCGDRMVGAHRLILALFLHPEKLDCGVLAESVFGSVSRGQTDSRLVDNLLEFLYRGSVTFPRQQSEQLLEIARESGFQILVDALVSQRASTPNADVVSETTDAGDQTEGENAETHRLSNTEIFGTAMPIYDANVESNGQIDSINNDTNHWDELLDKTNTDTVQELETKKIDWSLADETGIIGSCGLAQIDEEVLYFASLTPIKNETVTRTYRGQMDDEAPSDSSSTSSLYDQPKPKKCKNLEHRGPQFVSETVLSVTDRHQLRLLSANDEHEQTLTPCIACDHTNATNPPTTKSHFCSVHKKRFNSVFNLNPHLPHSTKTFVCTVCDRSFGRKSNLKRHARLRHISAIVQPHLGSTPRTDYKLTHLTKPANSKTHFCSICDMSFNRSSNLKRHLLTHVNIDHERQIKETHVTEPANTKSHVCSICEKSFDRASSLRRHFLTHVNADHERLRHFSAIVEPDLRSTPRTDYKQTHVTKPANTQTHVCSICKKIFDRPSSLNRHSLIHTKNKQFACTLCNSRFTQKGNLIQHLNTIHSSIVNELA